MSDPRDVAFVHVDLRETFLPRHPAAASLVSPYLAPPLPDAGRRGR
jgi:hypothetical protein